MYALTGQLANEYELDQKAVGLKDIVDAFSVEQEGRLYEGNERRTDLRKHIADHARSAHEDLYAQPGDLRKALDYLTAEYIMAGSKYAEIDESMFSLQRGIKYLGKDLTIPLFVRNRFGSKVSWEFEKSYDDPYKSKLTYKVSCAPPPVPKAIKDAAKKALKLFYAGMQAGLDVPIIGDNIMREQEPYSLWTYWIPDASQLKIVVEEEVRDPLLVAKVFDRHFLVTRWEVEHEEPYLHYLAEYKK